MHPTLERSRSFSDLVALDRNDTPYAFENIFAGDGFFARRRSKRKYKLLKRIDPRLREMLEEGERVRFVTEAADLSFWESYFLGITGYLTNRRALVLTDRRILLVQIDWRRRPKELMAQVRYPAIARIRRTGIGNTVLHLDDGSKRVLQGMAKADRKVLVELSERLDAVIQRDGGGVDDLCPHCFAVVDGRPSECAVCSGEFKSARSAMLRSLVFPGLGDFYLGHWKFAIWETLFAALIWLGALLPDPEYPLDATGFVLTAAILGLFIHLPDALLTRYIARKGIYPQGGAVGARAQRRRGRVDAPQAGAAMAREGWS